MFPSTLLLPAVILSTIGHGRTQACACPANWLYLPGNNRCYFSSIRIGFPMETYFVARWRCQEHGGDLATMMDDYEYRLIRGDLHDQNSEEFFWVGACWSPTDSSLKYVNGLDVPAVVTRGIISADPSFGAAMTSADGKLIDGNPLFKKHYVCQKETCSDSGPTAWCNAPQQSTARNMGTNENTVSEEFTTATNHDMGRQTLTTMEYLQVASGFTDITSSAPTSGSPTDAAAKDEGNGKSIVVYIGIGVGVFLVLVILCVLIVCIICRKRRNRKANRDYPQENNLNMDTKHTDQPLTTNMLTGRTNPSDKLMYEEGGYAEVDGHPNEVIPGKPVPAKDVVYDTAPAVDIGVARKHDINDMALYATPVRVRGNTEKDKDDDSSDEENTQIVENTIYGE